MSICRVQNRQCHYCPPLNVISAQSHSFYFNLFQNVITRAKWGIRNNTIKLVRHNNTRLKKNKSKLLWLLKWSSLCKILDKSNGSHLYNNNLHRGLRGYWLPRKQIVSLQNNTVHFSPFALNTSKRDTFIPLVLLQVQSYTTNKCREGRAFCVDFRLWDTDSVDSYLHWFN